MSTAKVTHIQSSRCVTTGQVIHTLMCEYPHAIHAQLLTHGVFSKNSSSSRAVPIAKAVAQLQQEPAEYIFTHNERGMQGSIVVDPVLINTANAVHEMATKSAIAAAECMDKLGIHKQNGGRYIEPFQNIRIVLTSTEWENWDWLRLDNAAQPEIQALAQAMLEARTNGECFELNEGEWHVPFIIRSRGEKDILEYSDMDGNPLSEKEALMISMSACAQTSYRNLDLSLKKAKDMYGKLFGGKKVHASPAEHQAKALPAICNVPLNLSSTNWSHFLPEGITHIARDGTFCSGNFRNFIQNRQLIPNHDAAIKQPSGVSLSSQSDECDGTGIN